MRAPILAKKKIHTYINISYCESQGRGETISINTYFTGCGGKGRASSDTFRKVADADALTFLPDRWLTTMSYGRRRHSVLFDPSRVTRNVGLSCASSAARVTCNLFGGTDISAYWAVNLQSRKTFLFAFVMSPARIPSFPPPQQAQISAFENSQTLPVQFLIRKPNEL
jgi:hypothetical protein